MSSELAALEAHLADYRRYLIAEKDDFAYTAEDHARALGYRLLASAALERYVEERCLGIARLGIERLARSQPTTSGRALVVWFLVRKSTRRAVPVHETDVLMSVDLAQQAFSAFTSFVRSSHGISGTDFKALVFAVGLRDGQLPPTLVDQLDALADRRNPASHSYVNRAKSMAPPSAEVAAFEQIMSDLRDVDRDLAYVVDTFPIPGS